MSPLSSADDSFHAPPDADPFWTETAWFGFAVPERRLAGALYPLFRPNQGVCSCGVYVWDDGAEEAWAVPYGRTWWHLPMPDHDLAALRLPSGLEYDVVEPLSRYRLRYRDEDEIEIDLLFEGLHEPHAIGAGATHGHFDQAGRVTGTLVLNGTELVVDCFEMRDRSWNVRRDTGPVRAGYDYGIAGRDRAFHVLSMFAGQEDAVLGGYLLEDGKLADVVSGRRTVERDDGRPSRVTVEADDALGRHMTAEGTCVNRLAFQSSPNYFAWMSLTRWDLGGVSAWGEDQDVWSPEMLRRFRREQR